MRIPAIATTLLLAATTVAAQDVPAERLGAAYRLADGRIVILTPDNRVIDVAAATQSPFGPGFGYGFGPFLPVPVPIGPCAPAEPLPDRDPAGYAHRRQQQIRESHLPPGMRTPNVGQYGWECAPQPYMNAWGRPGYGAGDPRAHDGALDGAVLRELMRLEAEARRREMLDARGRIRR